MMDQTTRPCRVFHRLLSKHVVLYTEMIAPGALLHGDRRRFLEREPTENPVVLQLGGSDPEEMARCAELGASYGYDAININVGCPSDRVRSGLFGACLMAEPERVAACVQAMRARAPGLPITVKTRIGIDDRDSYDDLVRFVRVVADGGCRTFIIHARKAWLQGLSPKENREIPPLRYDMVRRLKNDHPELRIEINGGIRSLAEARAHLDAKGGVALDGVMIGRAFYDMPYLLAGVDAAFYGDAHEPPTREEVWRAYAPYVARKLAAGARVSGLVKPLLGLYHGMPGARAWRRVLSTPLPPERTGAEILDAAWRAMGDARGAAGEPSVSLSDRRLA